MTVCFLLLHKRHQSLRKFDAVIDIVNQNLRLQFSTGSEQCSRRNDIRHCCDNLGNEESTKIKGTLAVHKELFIQCPNKSNLRGRIDIGSPKPAGIYPVRDFTSNLTCCIQCRLFQKRTRWKGHLLWELNCCTGTKDEVCDTNVVINDAAACHLCLTVRKQNIMAEVVKILSSVCKLHASHQSECVAFKNKVVCYFLHSMICLNLLKLQLQL